MNRLRTSACLGAATIAALAAQPVAATGGTGSKACNDGTITYTPTTVWPPNHKMVDVTVSYTDNDSDGDSISLAIVSITDNEMLPDGSELNGSGQPNPPQGADFAWDPTPVNGKDPGTVSTTVQVRAERAGTGDGRVYDIKARCTDKGGVDAKDTAEASPMGQMQTVDLLVTVPHDMGNHNGTAGGTTSASTKASAVKAPAVRPTSTAPAARISGARGLRLL